MEYMSKQIDVEYDGIRIKYYFKNPDQADDFIAYMEGDNFRHAYKSLRTWGVFKESTLDFICNVFCDGWNYKK